MESGDIKAYSQGGVIWNKSSKKRSSKDLKDDRILDWWGNDGGTKQSQVRTRSRYTPIYLNTSTFIPLGYNTDRHNTPQVLLWKIRFPPKQFAQWIHIKWRPLVHLTITVHGEHPNAQDMDAPRAHLLRFHNFCLVPLHHNFLSPSNSPGSTTRLLHKPPRFRRIENHFKWWEDMPADLYFLFLSFFLNHCYFLFSEIEHELHHALTCVYVLYCITQNEYVRSIKGHVQKKKKKYSERT